MKRSFLLSVFAFCLLVLSAQGTQEITLNKATTLTRTQSIDAAVALSELKAAYWEYRTFRADLLPEVNFGGTLPGYGKQYNSYQDEDGSYSFVRSNKLGLNGTLFIDQNIWFTGDKMALSSSLDFVKQLRSGGNWQFMSMPIALQLTQPIFGVSNLKQNRRIEPVRYEEAKVAFITATKTVTMDVITYFFNLLLAEETLGTARQNQINVNRLYKAAGAKRKMGQISKNELLQLKLAASKAQAAVTDTQGNLDASIFRLCSFLAIGDDQVLEPIIPESAPDLKIEYSKVLSKALGHDSFTRNIHRRQLEADYEVAITRGNLHNIDPFANMGYTGPNKDFSVSYQKLLDNQVVGVSVEVPILDWGKRRGKVRAAKSNREAALSKIRKEQIDFDRDIFLFVENFNNQAQQFSITNEANKVAQQRYKTSIETLLIGKINTFDLNDAQNLKDDARQKHISELYWCWYYFYQPRSLTLWDFQNNIPLEADFDNVMKNQFGLNPKKNSFTNQKNNTYTFNYR